MKKQVIQFNKFKTIISFALRRLKIKSLDLYSYFKSRINRTSHRRRSEMGNYITYLRTWRKAAYTSVVLLTLTTLAILFPISFRSATPVEGATKGATASTLTFTSNTSSTSASLSVSNSSGSFATSSSNASFSIETNNATGYTLNIKTGNDTTTLSDGNNHTIPSIETSKTASNFTNNTWGLLPSKYEGSNNTTNYYPASSNGFTMDTTSSSNTGNANTYTVGLGLKADYTIPAGTYTNTTIVAEYVANPITYAIYYYTNTTDTVTGMPSPNPQVPASSFPGTTATTTNLASAPSRTGYTFLGWCLGTSSSSNITVGTNGNADTCANSSTNQFAAGQSFGINATGSSPDLYYFYAMWQVNSYTVTVSNTNTTSSVASLTIPYSGSATVTVTPASGYYLSSVSCPSGYTCTGYNTGDDYTSTQTVTVANNNTASDGTLTFTGEKSKLYMQNMTFADCQVNVGTNGNAANVGDNITVYDRRDGKDYTVRYINGECWMTQNLRFIGTSLDSATSNVASTYTTSSPYYVNGSSVKAYKSLKDDSVCKGGYSLTADNSTNLCMQDSGSTTTGVWYNYAAASAGTITGTSNDTAAQYDICPKNWHLPSGPSHTADTDFNKLVGNTAGWQAATTGLTAFSAVGDGNYINGSLGNPGYGKWWSATAYDATLRYNLNYNSSDGQFIGSSFYYRNGGLFVRCVKDSDGYMQDFALADTTDGVEYTLKDKRDNKTYTAKKINGALWMTQNLRFTGTSVPSATSNVTADKTLTYYDLKTNGTSGKQCYQGTSSNPLGYTNACIKDSGSTTTGVWYNYAAATARTVTGYSNTIAASQDICPKNWHLPTGPSTTANTDINKLVGNTTSDWQSPTTGLTAFSAVAGGYYRNGSLSNTEYGFWWSATADSTTLRYNLYYNSSNVQFHGRFDNIRYAGLFVRCVRSS